MDDLGVGDVEQPADVLDHGVSRGGGEGQDGRPAQLGDGLSQVQIFGPEFVAPLADAVGLVDDEEVEADRLADLLRDPANSGSPRRSGVV
ncbi:MAG: hypothetical protein U0835_12275 [Isosphaeraceae bacterium]